MLDNKKGLLEVSSIRCAHFEDDPVYLIKLTNEEVTVNLTNFGSIITAIYTEDGNGTKKNIVAGFDDIKDYKNNPHYFGCALGRYAGRIAGGRFKLNDEFIQLSQNDEGNHLHGGFEGFNKKVWKVKSFIRTDETVGVIMEYLSENGEEGYPGNLWVKIKYTLNSRNQLHIEYNAQTDKSTPVNLSNHSYFNLSGFETGNILNHKLRVNASYYTEKSSEHLPTGNILSLAGTLLDFLNSKEIGKDIEQLSGEEGFNHNYVLVDHLPGEVILAAILEDEESGRILKVYTDQPAVQVYTANDWTGDICGQQGYPYQKHGAIALETQAFPDAPNHPNFPDAILHPGQQYLTTTIYQFETSANS